MFYGGQVGTLHGYVGPHRRGQIKQDMTRRSGRWLGKNKRKYLAFDWGQYWLLDIGPCLSSLKPSLTNILP